MPTPTGWYNTGSVSVTNNSANLVFSGGAALLSDALAQKGQGIIIGSGSTWYWGGFDSIADDTHATAVPNVWLSTGTYNYYIVPVQGYLVDLAKKVAAQADAVASYVSLAPNNGDYLQYLGTTPVPTTRSGLQVITDLTSKMAEVSIASASTCNIGAATSPIVQVTGVVGITSFGTVPNCLRFLRFGGALTLTHNGTSLVCPGGANITTAAGDTCIAVSDASGNWRIWKYQRAGSVPYTTASPTFTGTLTVNDASENQFIMGGSNGAQAKISTQWAGSGAAARVIFLAKNIVGSLTEVFRINGEGNLTQFSGPVGINMQAVNILDITHTISGQAQIAIANGSTGGTATANLLTSNGASQTQFGTLGAAYSGSGVLGANKGYIYANHAAGFAFVAASGPIQFAAGTAAEGWRIGTDNSLLGGTTTNGGWTGGAKLEAVGSGNTVLSVWNNGTIAGASAALVRIGNTNCNLLDFRFGTTQISYWSSNGSTSTFNNPSDARLKEWWSDQPNLRSAIVSLEMGFFTWKTGTQAVDFGGRAQQAWSAFADTPLQSIFVKRPDNDNDAWHMADYWGRIALWGVKDLYGLDALKDARISALEARVAGLERSVA